MSSGRPSNAIQLKASITTNYVLRLIVDEPPGSAQFSIVLHRITRIITIVQHFRTSIAAASLS
ncbi:uncharacterized protein ARMOST_22041 [Armillaria ostoyae]|uniref:Uncharacterized protein n=1 Tax=Armillaria ostoyae TaxID=47428 RepID=A0A284SBR4_ARMOS|nr:uncharacterized protein ARMOST_22041 [Armillaria ostoyae]